MPAKIVTPDWLNGVLHGDMTVFEYGSGGSTFYFAGRVRQVVSVEHDRGWFTQMVQRLEQANVPNVSFSLHEPQPRPGPEPPYTVSSNTSCWAAFQGKDYSAYVGAIDAYPDEHFDLVLVDGRARIACIARAMGKVKAGGYLMLDNADRAPYRPGWELLASWQPRWFHGIGPNCRFVWSTAVWRRPASAPPNHRRASGSRPSCDGRAG